MHYIDAANERMRERESLIRWLVANDPNGVYTDLDSDCEGMPRLTVEAARELKREQYARG